MRPPRLPLSGRIFILAFLNLVLLALVFFVFARLQFHAELGSFLFDAARERVLSVARELALDLEQTPPASRNDLLARYGGEYGMEFYLFEGRGTELAGKPVTLPSAVLEELQRRPPQEGRGPPPPLRDPPPEGEGRRGPPRPPRPDRRNEIFQMSAGGRYWVGSRIPVGEPGVEQTVRGTLIMAAPSLYSAPLLFDFKPWLAALVAVIAVFLLCWLPFIRGLTRAISQVTNATERIAEGHFDLHLPEDRRDELGQLSAAINRMAGRLSGFVLGQKRFLGDIAHELCAPVARMQFGLGILEQRAEPAQRAAVEDVQDEMRQMSALVGELLSFSKAGMRAGEKPLSPVDVGGIAREAVAREASEGTNVQIDIPQNLQAQAAPEFLLRALSNLVRNAIRYAGAAGPILISARRDGGYVSISVTDSGPGIPADELDRVFAPFYRVETSRNRDLGGTGLGLSIVKSCVEACGGTVECLNAQPGGLTVVIRLRAI